MRLRSFVQSYALCVPVTLIYTKIDLWKRLVFVTLGMGVA